jgi:hypothetical protein
MDRRVEAERIAGQRRGKSATYTQPLVGQSVEEQEDMHSFCAEFYSSTIFEKSSEMKSLLRTYPDTLGTHYAVLVPHVVSFDQFWSRYYYRCSVTTILAEFSRNQRHQSTLRTQMNPIVQTIQQQHPPPPHPKHSSQSPTSVTEKTIQNNTHDDDDDETKNNSWDMTTNIQQRTTLRAALHKEECDRDITETIQEEDEEEDDEEEEGHGIGFVPATTTTTTSIEDTGLFNGPEEEDSGLSEIPLQEG